MKYARRCSITGEGMNQGWCWGDGVFYSKYEKDTLASYGFHTSIGRWLIESMQHAYNSHTS